MPKQGSISKNTEAFHKDDSGYAIITIWGKTLENWSIDFKGSMDDGLELI